MSSLSSLLFRLLRVVFGLPSIWRFPPIFEPIDVSILKLDPSPASINSTTSVADVTVVYSVTNLTNKGFAHGWNRKSE